MEIVVVIGYRKFYFDEINEAITFAETAKRTCADKEEDVSVEITFKNGEESK